MKVLDSDIIIAFFQKDSVAIRRIRELMDSEDPLATTSINAYEVLVGVEPEGKAGQSARAFFSDLNLLDYDLGCVEDTVRIGRFLQSRGKPIGIFDTMIAGICLNHGAAIVTRNTSHFSEVPDLSVESW